MIAVLLVFLVVPFVGAEAATQFKDVKLYEEEITYLSDKGIIKGYEGGYFKPEVSIKRIQAVQMILREKGITDFTAPNPGFTDMKPGDYGYAEVSKAVQLGIIGGKTDAKTGKKYFDPMGTLTRGQMAKILVLAYDIKGTYNGSFTDVSPSSEVHGYVSALAANNITTGYGDNTFRPNATMSRQHFSLFFARYLNPAFKPGGDPVKTVAGLKDVPEDFWAAKEIEYLVKNEIARPFNDGTFRPEQQLTFVQLVEMTLRAKNIKISSEYPDPGFSDIKKGDPNYDIIATAVHEGFFGKGDGYNLHPDRYVSRFQAGTYLTRFFNLSRAWEENDFLDVTPTDGAYHAAETLASYGIDKGYSDNTFRPHNFITRAEFAVLLYRTLNIPEEVKNPQFQYSNYNEPIMFNGLEVQVGEIEIKQELYHTSYRFPVKITNKTDQPIKIGQMKLHFNGYHTLSRGGGNTLLPGLTDQTGAYFSIPNEVLFNNDDIKPKMIEFTPYQQYDPFQEPRTDSLKWLIN